MTTEEFSNEFDLLIDSYRRLKSFDDKEYLDSIEFNEYEKSFFLTESQEYIIRSLYSGKNQYNDSFENTEEIRRYLSSLIKTYQTTTDIIGNTSLSDAAFFFELPADLWFITYECVTFDDTTAGCKNGSTIPVIPVTQDDYYRTTQNPFKGANTRRALRLDIGDNTVEIHSKYNINKYLVRYVSRPTPIILKDLPNDLSINNVSIKTECELNSAMHRIILEQAVKMALNSKIQFTNDNNKK